MNLVAQDSVGYNVLTVTPTSARTPNGGIQAQAYIILPVTPAFVYTTAAFNALVASQATVATLTLNVTYGFRNSGGTLLFSYDATVNSEIFLGTDGGGNPIMRWRLASGGFSGSTADGLMSPTVITTATGGQTTAGAVVDSPVDVSSFGSRPPVLTVNGVNYYAAAGLRVYSPTYSLNHQTPLLPVAPNGCYVTIDNLSVTGSSPSGFSAFSRDFNVRTAARPVASFTATASGDVINVNGSGSTDADGMIARWDWDWDNDSVTDTSTAIATATSPAYSTSGSKTVGLIVVDNDGGYSNRVTQSATVTATVLEQFGAEITPDGAIITVTKNGSNVTFYHSRPPGSVSTRATINSVSVPSLARMNNGELRLLVKSGTSFVPYRSKDDGRTASAI